MGLNQEGKKSLSCIYNGDQLVLFYTKLLNRVYVLKENAKEISIENKN